MPELPEIELLRRELEREVGDRKIKAVEVPVAGVLSGITRKALPGAMDWFKFTLKPCPLKE